MHFGGHVTLQLVITMSNQHEAYSCNLAKDMIIHSPTDGRDLIISGNE